MVTRLIGASLAALILAIAGVQMSVPAVGETCGAEIAPVDPAATSAAWCVAGTLDRWKREKVMGVGQQVDIQQSELSREPLLALAPLRPAVVGFDFAEMQNAPAYFDFDPVPYLAELAAQGILLTATWHVANPATGGRYDDRSWTNISELLDPTTPAYQPFWSSYDAVLTQALRLQELGVAVIFKPLHEASGGWFWWGKPNPADFRRLFTELQTRAYAAGVHNFLWAYAANPRASRTDNDPVALMPDAVDLVGLDIYDGVMESPSNLFPLPSFRRLSNRAPRMALTEVGPRASIAGWSPRVVTDALRDAGLYAAFAMLWRDDPVPGPKYQISSMVGGSDWLAGCPGGLCSLRKAAKPAVRLR